MVFSWLRNLERGLIQGTTRTRQLSPRRRVMASVSPQATPVIVETLDHRRMLSANPIPSLISEILITPPGAAGTSNQYIELRGTPNATFASGTYLVGVSGTAATAGNVQDIFDLSGDKFGSNGFLFLGQKGQTYTVSPSATLMVNAGSGTGFGNGATSSIGHIGALANGNLTAGSETFLLVTAASASAPTLASTIDANHDGTPDGSTYSGWTILDSVGIRNSNSDFVYGNINFRNSAVNAVPGTAVTVAFTPTYVARMETSTGYGATDWVAATGLVGVYGGVGSTSLSFTSDNGANETNGVQGLVISSTSVTTTGNNIGASNLWFNSNGNVNSDIPPTVTSTGATQLTFTESGGAAAINSTVSITQTGSALRSYVYASGTVDITNFVVGEDVLSVNGGSTASSANTTNSGNVTINGVVFTYTVDNTSGSTGGRVTLSKAGGTTLANWKDAFNAVFYKDVSQNPVAPNRTVVYMLSDGVYNSPPLVGTIKVLPVNNTPTIASSAAPSTNEDTPVFVTGIQFGDVDWNPANTYVSNTGLETVTLSVTNGKLNINALVVGGVTAGQITGNGTASVTISATLPQLNATFAAATGIQYTPNLNFNGTDILSIGINDNGNTGFVSNPLSVSTTASITVIPVNDSPTISAPVPQTVVEDTPKVISGLSFADVDSLGANEIVTLSVTNGTLSLSTSVLNGLIASQITGNGSSSVTILAPLAKINATLADAAGLTYTPSLNYNGADSIAVGINDGGNTGSGGALTASASIGLTVTPVNDAPTISAPGPQTATEDIPKVISGLSFADLDSLGGNETVTLSVTNGTLTLSTSVVGGLVAGQITGNNSGLITIVAPLAAINATLANAAGLTYTSSLNYNGSDTLAIGIDDGGNTGSGGAKTASANVALTVTAVNDAPTIATPGPQTAAEDAPKVISGLSFADVDSLGGNETVTLTVTNGTLSLSTSVVGGLVAGQIVGNNSGSITITAPLAAINATLAAAAGLTYTPSLNYNGADTLAIVINDNGNTGAGGAKSASANVALTVTAVNDAPTIAAPGLQTTAEDTPKVISGLSFADVDSLGANETVTLMVTNGTLSLSTSVGGGLIAGQITGNNSGSITITAPLAAINATLADAAGLTYASSLNYNGADTLAIGINDNGNTGSGGAKSASASVALTVTAVNDAPTITAPGTQTTLQNLSKVISGLSFADVDSLGANETVTLTVSHGTISLSASVAGGIVIGQIIGNNSASVTITAPLAAINATLANAAGLTYSPVLNYNGTDTLAIAINDSGNTGSGGAKTASASVTLLIGAVNQPPSLTSIEGAPKIYSGNTPVTVTSTLIVADIDSPNMASATVTIGSGYQNGQDLLLFTNTTNITGNWVAATGTLTLTGSDTIANYQAALRSIQFQNSGTNTAARTVSFVVNDGFINSDPASRTVDAAPVVLSFVPTDANPGTGSVAHFAITFSESVGVISPSNFTLTRSGVTGGVISVSGSGASYNVTVSGLSGSGTIGVNLANIASILDSNSNPVAAGAPSPVLTLIQPGAPISFKGTALTIIGTAGNDVISVTQGANLVVVVNGVNFVFYPGQVLSINEIASLGNDSTTVNSLSSGVTFTSTTGSGNNSVVVNAAVTNAVTLIGGSGSNTLTGGAGNDTLIGGTGSNVISGGGGTDTFVLSAHTGGAPTKDTLTDTTSTNILSLTRLANGLTFSLATGSGVAQLANAAAGYSLDIASNVFKTVVLGAGNNNVTGNDLLGTTIVAGIGNTTLTGGAGNDTLLGGAGNSVIVGGGGVNILQGGAGNTTITGGAGNDTLIGGTGSNVISGGGGTDTFVLAARTAGAATKDTLTNSTSTNVLSLTKFTNGLTFSLATGSGTSQLADSLTNYSMDLASNVFATVVLGSGNNNVTGNSTSGTTIVAGAGSNTLTGGTANDTFVGGSGNCVLVGGGGNDTLLGGSGNNTITGGSGNDTLIGGAGSNVINGGGGTDTFILATHAGGAATKDTLTNSTSTNVLSLTKVTNGLTFSLAAGSGVSQLADSVAGYSLDIGSNVFLTVVLGSGNNNVTGNSTLGTTIVAGSGNNTLTGGTANDTFVGGSGNSVMTGGGGNDVLLGGSGNNTITGGSGNDTLIGGAASNVINGGGGTDTFILASHAGGVATKDTLTNSTSTNVLSLTKVTNGLTFSLAAGSGVVQLADSSVGYSMDIASNIFKTVVLGSGNNNVTGNSTLGTTIVAGSGNNTLIGGIGNDTFVGGSGSTVMTGGGGNDILQGGSGDNTITGGSGNDTLIGGIGNNVINGGGGTDTFILAARTPGTPTKDTLTNSTSTNVLSLTKFTNGLTFSLAAGSGVSQLADAIAGYSLDIASNVFKTVTLGSGDNFVTGNATLGTTIVGGAGNNVLIGGTGNDVLVGGSGNDILIGGAGGLDTLSGVGGDDILIGRTLSFSNDPAGLIAIQAAWNNGDTYANRVAALQAGVGPGNAFAINASTVATTPNTFKKTLVGGVGNDWFWANAIDYKDNVAGEQVN